MALSYSALRAASNAPRSAVISGGLGAIATATAKSLLRTQGYQQVYLLHPTFEDGKVEEVMANYTPEERRFLNPVSCDMLDESSVQARFAEMEIHSEHTLVSGRLPGGFRGDVVPIHDLFEMEAADRNGSV